MDRVPLEEVIDKSVDKAPQEDTPHIEGLANTDSIEYHRLANLLELDNSEREDSGMFDKAKLIHEWGQELVGSNDRLQIQMAIKHLTRTIGTTEKGTKLVNKLYQWIRLDQSRRRIGAEMEMIRE